MSTIVSRNTATSDHNGENPVASGVQRMWRLVLALLSAVVCLVPLAAAPNAAAAEPQLVTIVSPVMNAKTTNGRVDVKVKLAPMAKASTLVIKLNERVVNRRLLRVQGLYTVVLTERDGIGAGGNLVSAEVEGANGQRSRDARVFTNTRLLDAPPPVPVPFTSRSSFGGTVKVTVGSQVFTQPELLSGCGVGVWILQLTRTFDANGPQLAASTPWPMCSTADGRLLRTLLGRVPEDQFVVVNALRNPNATGRVVVSNLGTALNSIGATNEFNTVDLVAGSFSIVGISGLPAGQAYQRGGSWADDLNGNGVSSAAIVGELDQDSNQNFAVNLPDTVSFDLSSAGRYIRVGTEYFAADPEADVGYFTVTLDRTSLLLTQPAPPSSQRFYPMGPDVGDEDRLASARYMSNDLLAVAADENQLVFVISIGNPTFPTNGDAVKLQLTRAFEAVGLSSSAIPSSATPAAQAVYAGVGAASPPQTLWDHGNAWNNQGVDRFYGPESSPMLNPKQTGDISGGLRRGTRGMWYEPVTAGVKGANFQLFDIVGQTTAAWPVPARGNTPQANAYAWFSKTLSNLSDVRENYLTANDAAVTNWLSVVRNDSYGNISNPNFDRQSFTQVQAQLIAELTYVSEVNSFYDNLRLLTDEKQTELPQSVTNAVNEVKKIVSPPENTFIDNLIDFLVSAGNAAAGDDLVGGDIIESALEFGLKFATDKSGQRLDDVESEADKLGEQALETFVATEIGLSHMRAKILRDWGKLSALGAPLSTGSADWYIDPGNYVASASDKITISAYKGLLPVIYESIQGIGLINTRFDEWNGEDVTGDIGDSYYAYQYASNAPAGSSYAVTWVGSKPIYESPIDVISYGIDSTFLNNLNQLGVPRQHIYTRFPWNLASCAVTYNSSMVPRPNATTCYYQWNPLGGGAARAKQPR